MMMLTHDMEAFKPSCDGCTQTKVIDCDEPFATVAHILHCPTDSHRTVYLLCNQCASVESARLLPVHPFCPVCSKPFVRFETQDI